MRTILFLVAVATLGLGNEVFAQAAPKEVVVVDGQIAVNNFPNSVAVSNLPATQDVFLQGTINPIPVVDAASNNKTPWMGNGQTEANTRALKIFEIPIPQGKQFVLKGAHMFTSYDSDVVEYYCDIFVEQGVFPNSLRAGATLPATAIPSVFGVSKFITVTQQLDGLPPADKVLLSCFGGKAPGTSPTTTSALFTSWWGDLVDKTTVP